MANEKQEESFRVIDRRLFTPEGELRKEALEQEAARANEGASTAAGAPQRSPAPDTAAPSESAAATREAARPSRSFQLLVDFLYRNAALLLGGYADPRTGQAILDLNGARELIDMLDALQEKTKGNLAPDDERFLLDSIGSLKMSYLEMSTAAAQALREKAQSKS